MHNDFQGATQIRAICGALMGERDTPPSRPDLSLSEDDEGARFGAGLGFRARGFGAAFSVNHGKKGQK